MEITQIVNWMSAIFYGIAFTFFLTAFPFFFWKKKRDLRLLETRIKEKIEKDINLEPKDIVALGKALDFGPIHSRKPIYNLLLHYDDKEKFQKINNLRDAIEREEPFDDMPDEVKPSLVRISALVEKTDDDKQLLLPVYKTLAKYVELESERDKFRSRARWGTIIAVFSLLMGAFSFYQSLHSPTIEQIQKVLMEHRMSENNKNEIKQINSKALVGNQNSQN